MKLFALFILLSWLLGNPFLALIVMIVVLYALERRFLGITPSLLKPFRRRSQRTKLRRQLQLNPHDKPAKTELARLLIDSGKYTEAHELLLSIQTQMDHSAEYWSDLGRSELALGRVEEGERSMLQALSINSKVKYGMPYLLLGEALAGKDDAKALVYLKAFQDIHSSSCEAYYRLGKLYTAMGQREAAQEALATCRQVYKTLPRYMKRHERKWALRAMLAMRK